MINNKLKENKSATGFIFDGFPRTIPQAEALDELLERNGTQITCMVALEVEDEELIKRLLNRGKTSGRADDQDETLARKRIGEYNDKTLPVAQYYKKQQKFASVNGIGEIDEIFNNICEAVERDKNGVNKN
jgi:adenylate kinase